MMTTPLQQEEIDIDSVLEKAENGMKNALAALRHDLTGINVGRANPEILNAIIVEAYGSRVPIHQVASITASDAKTLSVQVWDVGLVNQVEKAISAASDLGLTPHKAGTVIRINIPEVTTERRQSLVKFVKSVTEKHRVAVRNTRRHANDDLKKLLADDKISEDEEKNAMKIVQELTDKHIAQLDDMQDKKIEDISTI